MKSILAGLTLTTWIVLCHSFISKAQSQHVQDGEYCLSISQARLLVRDALRLRVADSLLQVQSSRIYVLQTQYENSYSSFTNLIKIEQDKNKIQSEIILHSESISEVYKEENTHLKKKVRGLKWQRFGLAVAVVVITVLSL